MDTITSIEKIDTIKESVVTIGNFDGLHRGHQVLIKKTTEYAKANNISSVVFTFKNHPVNYFRPGSIKNIITSEEKIKILKSMGVDYVINIPFDEYMTMADELAMELEEYMPEDIIINARAYKWDNSDNTIKLVLAMAHLELGELKLSDITRRLLTQVD